MDYVIDASAWLRHALQDGPAGEDLANALVAPELSLHLHAPHILAAEVAHALHRLRGTGRLTTREASEHLESMLALSIHYHSVPELTPAAFRLARQHRLSVYDALYLALAMGMHARLLTVDDDLARAARAEGCA